jgi:hypothetical protein
MNRTEGTRSKEPIPAFNMSNPFEINRGVAKFFRRAVCGPDKITIV